MRFASKLLLILLFAVPLHAATITSVTTPGTYNWSSGATWVGGVAPGTGDRTVCSSSGVIIVIDTSLTVGDSPTAGTNVITQSGGCIIFTAQNVTFTVKGGWSKLGTVRRSAGSTILFDSTSAGSPTTTAYTLTDNGSWTDDPTHPPTNSVGNQFTITANASGTNWRWVNSSAGSGITGMSNAVISNVGDPLGLPVIFTGNTTSGSNVIASPSSEHGLGVGDPISGAGLLGGTTIMALSPLTISTNATTTATGTSFTALTPVAGLTYSPGGNGVLAIGATGPVTFNNTCGITWGSGTTVNDGWNLSITFKNTYSQCVNLILSTLIVPAGGVTRTTNNMVFDSSPFIQTPGAVWNYPIFYNGFSAGVFPQNIMGVMNYPWIRVTNTAGQAVGLFNMNNAFIFWDTLTTYSAGAVHNPVPFKAGSATATSSSSITDSTASFPPTMIDGGGGPASGYCVAVTTGAAAGEVRGIFSIGGTTVINTWLPFTVTPSPGDSYTVYQGNGNPHYTSLAVVGAATANYEHTMGWFHGCDFNGDFWHAVSQAGVTYNFDYTIVMANLARGNVGTLGTIGAAAAGLLTTVTHSTYFVGQQGMSTCEGCDPNTGKITKFIDNIAWQDPTVNYNNQGGYMADVSQGVISATPIDSIAVNCGISGVDSCADFNGSYGIPGANTRVTPGYCSTIHGGSPLYNVNCSVPMGTHDVTGDPGFPNRWASPLTWAQSLGVGMGQGDAFDVLADTMNQMMSVNDPSGYNAAFSPTAFYNYIQAAFTPTNSAFHATGGGTSGPDGSDIGAVPFAATSIPNGFISGAMNIGGSSQLN